MAEAAPGERFSLNKTDQFDIVHRLGHQRRQRSGNRKSPPEFAYHLTCFCGSEIRLVPGEGRTRQCPDKCGGRATFKDQRVTLEMEAR